ncbi:zinc-ribbon and DUF3426 domain-containing protein [Alcaligenes endophyticus]|uniref:Zinc-ribbon domain-containing protein n=1 Tax=Alcaligenes endophyticus TaxID=1929088 RepID=A0ABT8EM27_9BURK|nr:zinc-ribbon and DUF3426 domain-containing protein [Alcaligenes endophyticus]MCX5591079.1 zinc-ribbon and DUF3426 domain-containing protein [Alcaligenes endophyticus]MDN4122343.1 zinc-ribbon domain-containing protein [Alcaligenes endophyticus]
MELNTRCPRCEAVFAVSVEQLQRRRGYIRCQKCAHIFDGFEAVLDEPLPGKNDSTAAIVSLPSSEHGPLDSSQDVVIPRLKSRADHLLQTVYLPGLNVGMHVQELSRHAPPAHTEVRATELVVRRRSDFSKPEAESGHPQDDTEQDFGPAQGLDVSFPPASLVLEPFVDDSEPYVSASPVSPLVSETPSVIRARGQDQFSVFVSPQDPESDLIEKREPSLKMPFAAPPIMTTEERNNAADDNIEPIIGAAELDNIATADSSWVMAADQSRMSETVYEGEPTFWRRLLRGFLVFVCVVGLLLAAVQLVYIYRVQIASHVPFIRPTLEYACAQVACDVPYERRLAEVGISTSSFQNLPGDAGQANLNFTLKNRFTRALEWPALTLELKDFSGALLVRRNIPPLAYLGPEKAAQPFSALSSVAVQVPVSVSDLQVNGYQLSLYFP